MALALASSSLRWRNLDHLFFTLTLHPECNKRLCRWSSRTGPPIDSEYILNLIILKFQLHIQKIVYLTYLLCSFTAQGLIALTVVHYFPLKIWKHLYFLFMLFNVVNYNSFLSFCFAKVFINHSPFPKCRHRPIFPFPKEQNFIRSFLALFLNFYDPIQSFLVHTWQCAASLWPVHSAMHLLSDSGCTKTQP